MARLPRFVIPGQPQHIIQRGNNRQTIFAVDADYQFFRDALVVEAAGLVWYVNGVRLSCHSVKPLTPGKVVG
jgi:REP element-mobilizing transposase RayT